MRIEKKGNFIIMKSFKIFLASSSELKEDRDAFRIFLSVENDRLHKKE